MKKAVALLMLCALVISSFAACKAGESAETDLPQTGGGAPATLAAEPVNVVITEETPETEIPTPPANQEPPAYVSEVAPPAQATPAPAPNVVITEVNETVWATEAVNVRLGASASCERIGGLWAGDSVTRTGLADNGWSRIVFNGRTAYVKSDYLTNLDPNAVKPSASPAHTSEAAQTAPPSPSPSPSVEVSPSPPPSQTEPSPSPSPEATPSAPPDVTPSPSPEATPAPTPTPTPTPTPPPAPTPTPAPEFTITTLSSNVSADNINATLYKLCKEIGSRRVGIDGNYQARQYIYSQLQSMGFSEADGSLWKHEFYSTGDLFTENILCSIPSKTGSDAKIVAVSAHFDSVRGVEGALDNGSGTAALLEACRVIKESGVKFDFELRFCFFSAEEDGYKGAYEYIRRQGPNISKHICNFNIDMAGYAYSSAPKALVVSTKGDPATSNWNPAQPNIMSGSIVTAYYALDLGLERYYSPTNAGKHDGVAFWNADVPTATLSWREIDPSRAYGNDLGVAAPAYIHSSHDCLENLSVDSVVTTTRLVVTSICALGEKVTS